MRSSARRPPAAAAVVEALRIRGETLATAESLTGGLLASLVTQVPGASAVYRGGVVAYASQVKVDVLGVSARLIEEHGVVSAECAGAMARGVRLLTGATYGISTTGVAGPDLQEGKPVGTVYVALVGPDGDDTVLGMELAGDRAAIRERTCHEALVALTDRLSGPPSGPLSGRAGGESGNV